jgi:hypothetical protein
MSSAKRRTISLPNHVTYVPSDVNNNKARAQDANFLQLLNSPGSALWGDFVSSILHRDPLQKATHRKGFLAQF